VDLRLLVWKKISENDSYQINHHRINSQTDADWLQAFHARSLTPQLCHTWTRAISRTHTEQEGVIAFAVLRGWNILDLIHALGCWFLMGWTLDSRCHYHLNAHCSGFDATFSDTWLAEHCLKLWPFHASEFTTVFSFWQSLCHVPADHQPPRWLDSNRLTDKLRSTLTGFLFTLQLDRPNNTFLTIRLLKLQMTLEFNVLGQTA